MNRFELFVEPDALSDIQSAADWYDSQLPGLGSHFQAQAIAQISSLKSNCLTYAVRYKKVRCMIIKKFPYLVHFVVNERRKTVEVFAVFHTSRNPRIWLKRRRTKK
ncbi:MAG: type II toxin-antitoxin system RelE/ParE family toxin [Cyclobacteriaceae bacterium]|nr:type II toxin-antitoxin system RelE/ParE family toxin [Cyclobacteriaceae bacterium]